MNRECIGGNGLWNQVGLGVTGNMTVTAKCRSLCSLHEAVSEGAIKHWPGTEVSELVVIGK